MRHRTHPAYKGVLSDLQAEREACRFKKRHGRASGGATDMAEASSKDG